MLKKVKEYVTKWHMLEKEDKVIVGVSGGADSICLLFVLMELQKCIPFEIIVVHVNHGLRGADADADEAYVKTLCQKYNIVCVTYSENVELIAKNRKQSTEEAGRDVRREALKRTMETYGGTKIALAHHKNDNVETFFMNLARGTGLKGLGGIRPVAGNMIRPMLCLERREIEQYLNERNIFFCIDQTNSSDTYTRNRLRNHVIPYFEEEINSCAVSHINDTMEQLLEIQTFLEEERDIYLQDCVKKQGDRYIILEEVFQTIPKIFKPIVIKTILSEVAGKEKDISAAHLSALQELFLKQVGRKIDLPYKIEACRIYEGVCLQKRMFKESKEIEIPLTFEKEQRIVLNDMTITCKILEDFSISDEHEQKSNTKRFDYDIIKSGLCVRTRKPGDYITIHSDGKKQKLKSYFINEKIPQEERNKVLLVADGNHILWIIGYRTNCLYQISRNTKRVLEIQMDKGENYGRDN